MNGIDYLNFDLQIERSGNEYIAQVLASPAGEAQARFKSPFSDETLLEFRKEIDRLRGAQLEQDIPISAAVKKFGGHLFETVFDGPLRGIIRASLEKAEREETGLRLRLRLKNVPDLATLPWEFLYNSEIDYFFNLFRKTPIIRYIDLPHSTEPLKVASPINVLVMISSPLDLPHLDIEQEWAELKDTFRHLEAKGLVKLEKLENATLPALQKKLNQGRYHIFHYIGHGDYNHESSDGVLFFEDENQMSYAESGEHIGIILNDHPHLRLAILNTCKGAMSSAIDPFAGTAQDLVQKGLPAVVAMQFPVTDKMALTFTDNFYEYLAEGYPIDAAMAEARKSILAEGCEVEWATPVLYMRSPDGYIFDFDAGETKPFNPIDTVEIYEPQVVDIPTKPRPTKKKIPLIMAAGIFSFLLISILFDKPPLLNNWLNPPKISTQKHLAILPFVNLSHDSTNQIYCYGLMHILTSKLTQLEQFSDTTLWVVPPTEIQNHHIVTICDAKRVFGVNLAITGSVYFDRDAITVTMNLVDVASMTQLNSVDVTKNKNRLDELQDEAFIQLARLIELELEPFKHRQLESFEHRQIEEEGGTGERLATDFYIQGKGYLLSYSDVENNINNAIDMFTRAVEQDSGYAEAYVGLGEAYWRLYEITKDTLNIQHARSSCSKAIRLNSSLERPYIIQAEIHIGTGNYAQAVEACLQAQDRNRNSADAHRILALAYENMGRLQEAEATYKKAISLRPGYWVGYNHLGVFYYYQARYEEAVAQFQKVTRLTPENARGYFNLGTIYSALNRIDEAKASFERAIEIEPSYEAYSNLGTLFYNEGNFIKAVEKYRQALNIDARDYVVWANLAAAYFWIPDSQQYARPNFERAIAIAEQQKQVNPNDAELLADLSGYYARVGNHSRAIEYVEQALELAPKNVAVMAIAAQTYEALNQRDRSLHWIRQAIENGYAIVEIEREPGFNALRQDERYRRILEEHAL